MRVLVVNAHGADATGGGVEQCVADLGRGLRAEGCAVTLLAAFPARVDAWDGTAIVLHGSDWRDDAVRRWRNHAGDVASFPTRRLAAAVAEVAPDVLHTHNLPGITTAVWEVARRAGVPVVHTVHDYYLLCPRVTLRKRTGEACEPHPLLCGARNSRLGRWHAAVDDVIAVSDHVAGVHAAMFPSARMHVVRNPVAALPRSLAPPRTPPRSLGYLGALSAMKGVGRLLDAAPHLLRRGLTLRIAGDGELAAEVERAVADGAVEYAGVVHGEDKLRFIESCDLAILPSLWDEPGGPPCSVAEWLAAGRPILVSMRGGLQELPRLLPGVVPVEPTQEAIVEAVDRLLVPARFEQVLTAMPGADAREFSRWIDDHREIYETAASSA
jgi:glycosyltransferase involved in cell wall biosynthesis